MFSSFFRAFTGHKEWVLRPIKLPREARENYSSKVLLPYSMLRELSQYNMKLPYIFEIAHENGMYRTNCSVLDFALDTDEIHVPSWMFEQLNLDSCSEVTLSYASIPRGSGIKLLPHSIDFLSVENPRAELEKGLLDYHVLTYGDEILLSFEEFGNIRFTVTQIQPEEMDAIYLVDTDLSVDFDEPIGYRRSLEEQKSVLKYVEIADEEGDVKGLRMQRIGLFLDWDSLGAQPAGAAGDAAGE